MDVNAFVSVINPNVDDKCPFGKQFFIFFWTAAAYFLVSSVRRDVQNVRRHVFSAAVYFRILVQSKMSKTSLNYIIQLYYRTRKIVHLCQQLGIRLGFL